MKCKPTIAVAMAMGGTLCLAEAVVDTGTAPAPQLLEVG